MIGSPTEQTQPPDLLDAANVYVATFAGRTDVYSYWAPDRPDNPAHWSAVRQPLTGQRVLTAFQTGIPLSTYLLTTDSYTYIAALDIDRDNGLESGKRFARHIQKLGGICYVEPSRRGCHVWIVMDDKRPAVLVRRALKGLIEEAGLPHCPGCDRQDHTPTHLDPKIELRPGSDKLNGPDSLGHCIRMPTMPHQTTGKRYRLYSSDGEAISGKLTEMMLAIEECPVAIMDDAAGRAPLPPISGIPPDLRFPHGDPPVSGSACDVLTSYWGVIQCRPGIAIKCPAHDDHSPSLSIARDDQRVWCKTGGCILSNDGRGRGINELVRLAPRGGT